MPAKKKTKKTTRRAPAKKKVKHTVASKTNYHHQRDQFYADHPNSKWLLALLIIAIAVWVGIAYRNYKARQYQALQSVEDVLGESIEFLQ